MLASFQPQPLSTFESFLATKPVQESRPPGTQEAAAAFDTSISDLTQAKVDALSKHDSAVEATQSLFDQACILLNKRLERELDAEEWKYAEERCAALCGVAS